MGDEIDGGADRGERVCERTSRLIESLAPPDRALLVEMLKDDRTYIAGDMDELLAILTEIGD